ncbi:MAG TPA: septum formation family protein [Actinoplanes sp.]|nr:septum formation family protein [Actinoplanes sp.]
MPGRMKRWWTVLVVAAALGVTAGCGSLPYGIDGNLTDDWPAPARPESFRPAADGCFDALEPTAPLASYAPFDCAERHVAEAYFVGDLTGDAASPDADDAPRDGASPAHIAAAAECGRRATTFLGAEWRHGRLRLQPVLPASKGWAAGARWFRCDIAQVDVSTDRVVSRTGSLRDALRGAAPLALTCFNPTVRDDRVRAMRAVRCADRHYAEFAGLWTAPDIDFADLVGNDAMAAGCRSVIAGYAGVPDDGDLRFRVGWLGFAPTRAEWELGVRSVQCFLWLESKTMKGSYRGAGTGKLPINYA